METIRKAYAAAAKTAQWSILRHPSRSMAETLRVLADRAEGLLEPDVYGRGELIESFELNMAKKLGKPAALFLGSGTLAQPLALKLHSLQRGKNAVALHPTSHLVLHEHDGYQQLWGLEGHLVGEPNTPIHLNDLHQLPAENIAALVLELPMREIGGQLPQWHELQAQVAWARQHDIAVHFDGARLWHCPAAYQRSLAEICDLADSVYVSLYKDIGGIAGAILAGPEDFIAQARIWARRAGGNLISWYPYVLAAELGLEENLTAVDEAVSYAQKLGPMLGTIQGVTVQPEVPQAAMFHLHIEGDADTLIGKITRHAELESVIVLPLPRATVGHSSVFEISVGRRTMAEPPEFWLTHLAKCLGR
jgi:threonine aldolase